VALSFSVLNPLLDLCKPLAIIAMKKTTFILLIIVFAISCGPNKPEINQTKSDISGVSKTTNQENQAQEKLKLPEGIKLDSIIFSDEKRKLEIFILIPVSGISKLDKALRIELENRKNNFIESVDKRIEEDKGQMSEIGSDFDVNLVSAYKDKDIISYCFVISFYHGGAAHPMTIYYSFNYDLKREKKITFSDYFNVESTKDTIFLTDLMTKAINTENISVTNLNDMDFNIEKDTISFNFDDYEIASYAEGIIQARINKSLLKKNIKSNYR
jgi:hypothetical protein